MNDPADTRFFEALDAVCQRATGVDQTCREAVTLAAQTGDPLHRLAARKALDGLDDSLRSDLLRQVHFRMASDVSAIWDALSGAPGKQRPN